MGKLPFFIITILILLAAGFLLLKFPLTNPIKTTPSQNTQAGAPTQTPVDIQETTTKITDAENDTQTSLSQLDTDLKTIQEIDASQDSVTGL